MLLITPGNEIELYDMKRIYYEIALTASMYISNVKESDLKSTRFGTGFMNRKDHSRLESYIPIAHRAKSPNYQFLPNRLKNVPSNNLKN